MPTRRYFIVTLPYRVHRCGAGRRSFFPRLHAGCALPLRPHPNAGQGIAVLKSHDIEPFKQAIAGFVTACNGQITEYDLPGSKGKQRSIIERIVAARPKLILAIGAMAAQVANEMVQDIPVVFFMVPNPQIWPGGKNVPGSRWIFLSRRSLPCTGLWCPGSGRLASSMILRKPAP